MPRKEAGILQHAMQEEKNETEQAAEQSVQRPVADGAWRLRLPAIPT